MKFLVSNYVVLSILLLIGSAAADTPDGVSETASGDYTYQTASEQSSTNPGNIGGTNWTEYEEVAHDVYDRTDGGGGGGLPGIPGIPVGEPEVVIGGEGEGDNNEYVYNGVVMTRRSFDPDGISGCRRQRAGRASMMGGGASQHRRNCNRMLRGVAHIDQEE